jgi:hypothetical protein
VTGLARSVLAGPVPAAALLSRADLSLGATVRLSADSSGDADCAGLANPAAVQTTDATALFEPPGQLGPGAAILHVTGDTTLAGGGRYDGILIVDGTLTIDGPFTLTGLLIARGGLRTHTDVHVIGSLIVHASTVEMTDTEVRHAPCLVAAQLRRIAPIRPVRERGWAELYR